MFFSPGTLKAVLQIFNISCQSSLGFVWLSCYSEKYYKFLFFNVKVFVALIFKRFSFISMIVRGGRKKSLEFFGIKVGGRRETFFRPRPPFKSNTSEILCSALIGINPYNHLSNNNFQVSF